MSETTTEPAETSEAAPAAVTDWEAEASKWKTLADQTEKRAKRFEDTARTNADAAKRLADLEKQSMTDLEKAVAEARAQARAEALAEVGSKLVSAEIRAAAAGRNVDADALVDGINAARFLGDDGEPDRGAITAWLDKVAPAVAEQPNPGYPDLGQGGRGQPLALNGDPLEQALRNAVGAKR